VDLRQAAAYGLGIAAQHRREAFRPVASQSTQLLVAIASAPDAHSDQNASATDNAVAALGKVHPWVVCCHLARPLQLACDPTFCCDGPFWSLRECSRVSRLQRHQALLSF